MKKVKYLKLLQKKILYIGLSGLFCASVALLISAIIPGEYKSTVSLLVIQKSLAASDSYTAARAAERLATNLENVIYTTSFYDKVFSSGRVENRSTKTDEQSRREEWEKKIETSVVPETGIMTISAYDTDRAQSEALVSAVAYVLSEQSSEYYGGTDAISISIIDSPLTSNYPVRPNVYLNILAGLVIGLISSIGYFILRYEVDERKGHTSIISEKKEHEAKHSKVVHPHKETLKYSVLDVGQNEVRTMEDELKDWVE